MSTQSLPPNPRPSLRKTGGLVKSIEIVKLDLGTIPPKIDSVRVLQAEGDELIVESPLFWGSNLSVDVAVVLAAPKLGLIKVPVTVSNVQVKAHARFTIKPLVETLPCVGGVTISLLEVRLRGEGRRRDYLVDSCASTVHHNFLLSCLSIRLG